MPARGTVQPKVLAYMNSNADAPITVDELEHQIGANRNSISGALVRLSAVYPNLEKKTKSSWIWHSTPPEKKPDYYFLKHIQEKDGKILALDEDNQKMYVLTELEF